MFSLLMFAYVCALLCSFFSVVCNCVWFVYFMCGPLRLIVYLGLCVCVGMSFLCHLWACAFVRFMCLVRARNNFYVL